MSDGAVRSFGRSVVCPTLIGRSSVLDALHRWIDGVDGADCRTALIAGEAGIGKSRLVGEARTYAAERGVLVLEGASFPQDRTSPYAPLLELLRTCFADRRPEVLAAAVGPFAGELFPLLPDLFPGPTDPPPRPELDAEQDRQRLFAALAHCLLGQSAHRPVLVVVEDLHWCDDGSLDFLLYLARRAATVPLRLLGTYRGEDADARLRGWLAQLDRERLARELTLAPLSREEVGAMLAAIFGDRRRMPAELLDTLYSLSEGNPFSVEELLKSLLEAGAASETDRARDWTSGPAAEWRIPRSLHEAVQQRVARLSPAAREVLTLAAVVGRRFDFGLLQLLAQVDERTLLSLIKELIAAQLVVEESRDLFAFRHALTRQSIYAELLGRERVALHRTVAEAAEQIYAEAQDQRLDDLAYHFHEAESWDKALAYGRRAGERARRLYAPRAAVEHLTRALDAARHLTHAPTGGARPVPTSMLVGLHRARGQAYETLGEFALALADYEACVELARAAGDQRAEWEGLLDLGVLWTGRDYEQSGARFQRALELARQLGEPALIARGLNCVGNWQVNTSQPREALPLHREALSIYEALGDREGIAATLDLLGMASYLSADLPGSIGHYERAAAISRELDDRPGLVSSLAMLAARGGSYELGSAIPDSEGFTAGVRDGERAVRLARAIDWRAGETFALFQLAAVLGLQGEYARALEAAQRSLGIAEEIEHRQWLAGAHCTLGQVYLDLLALPAARRHLEQALGLAREVRSTFWVQLVTACLAWSYVLERDLGRAAAILGPVPDGDAPVQSLGERWINYGHLQLALARRDPALALRLIDRASAPALDGTASDETPRPALARGAALTALGRYPEAELVLRAVQHVTAKQGARPLLWRSHAALGEVYRAQQRPEDAQREFSAARTIIEELAANLPDDALRDEFLRNATAGLPRPYRLSPGRVAAARHAGLTAREREVAALIARGKSNREIADALILGERTIETHVSHVLNKLGVSSRREIGRWALEHGLAPDGVSSR